MKNSFSPQVGLASQLVLSVVVIGKNEGERLARCLKSVRAMRGEPDKLELIYVDAGSTDGSAALAASFGAKVLPVYSGRLNAPLARNIGWRAASAPFVLFLDGNTILDPDFVAKSLRHFADPSIAVISGDRREIDPDASIYNRVLELDAIFKPGQNVYCGGDALMRRNALREVGGFDATLIAGAEVDLCNRLRARNYKILHTAQPMTGHELAVKSLTQYWRRALRAGYADAQLLVRSRTSKLPIWKEAYTRQLISSAAMMALMLYGVGGSALLGSPWPLAIALLIFMTLTWSTAQTIAWKTPNKRTRWLYGAHAHLQHLPRFLGQLLYLRDQWEGQRSSLVKSE